MRDLVWDKRMLGAFIEHACLTEEEVEVLRDLAYDKDRAGTAMRCHMSQEKVDKIRKRLRIKYDLIQPYVDELPPRKTKT